MLNNVFFGDDYEITKHGIDYNNSIKNIISTIECPDCGSKQLGAGQDNYLKTDKHFGYYFKECVCENCWCEFNFRISNMFNIKKGLFKKKLESKVSDSYIENSEYLRSDIL